MSSLLPSTLDIKPSNPYVVGTKSTVLADAKMVNLSFNNCCYSQMRRFSGGGMSRIHFNLCDFHFLASVSVIWSCRCLLSGLKPLRPYALAAPDHDTKGFQSVFSMTEHILSLKDRRLCGLLEPLSFQVF